MRNTGWFSGTSLIGYCDGGSTRPISRSQWYQAREPQKSSTQSRPPLSRYSRRRATSSLLKPMVPTSAAIVNGQLNSASSMKRTTQWFGSPRSSTLTRPVVRSENRIIRLMPAYG